MGWGKRVGGGAIAAGVIVSCLAPTQFTVSIYTDLPCEAVGKTQIFVGEENQLRAGTTPAVAETTACQPRMMRDNFIGSIVIVPSHSTSDRFTVRALLSRKGAMGAVDCSKGPGPGCIEAWRTAGFVTHSALSMSITLSKACENRMCPQGTTCVAGACINNNVDPMGELDAGGVVDAGSVDEGVAEASVCLSPLAGLSLNPAFTPTIWRLEGPGIEDDAKTHIATLAMGASFEAGAPGCNKGLRLSGSTMQSLNDPESITKFAIGLWISAKGDGPVINRTNLISQGQGWSLSISGGVLQFTGCTNVCNGITGKTNVVGGWHRVAIVFYQGVAELYVDGKLDVMGATIYSSVNSDVTLGPMDAVFDQLEQVVLK